MTTRFKAGGPLMDAHEGIYISRSADDVARQNLRAMNYLLIIEPRHQGKTSLINNMMRHPAATNLSIAYVDVTTVDRSSERSWYQTLCPRILRQFRAQLSSEEWPKIPHTNTDWREFLSELAVLASRNDRYWIIALDEIGAVAMPGDSAFFSVMRDIYNSRQGEDQFRHLAFLLAGAFHPRDLIQDDRISPFNIAERLRLRDFSAIEVFQLVSRSKWREGQALKLAARIHYWTNGQPYLTQYLCARLSANATAADVDDAVDRLRRDDENHLRPLLERLKRDAAAEDYLSRVETGERIKFYPGENRRQAHLELLGILSCDEDGCCKVRNRIYAQALKQSRESEATCIPPREKRQDGFLYDVFISYSHKDKDWVCEKLLPVLEGAGLRACVDFRDFEIGVHSLLNIEAAINQSRKIIIVLTPHWISSEWSEFEAALSQSKDPSGRQRRILPLLVQSCSVPQRLSLFTHLDLRQPAEFSSQIARLVATLLAGPTN